MPKKNSTQQVTVMMVGQPPKTMSQAEFDKMTKPKSKKKARAKSTTAKKKK